MNKQKTLPPVLDPVVLSVVVQIFRPGDLIFIESEKPLSRELMAHVNAEFKRLIPEARVVVLQAGLKVKTGAKDE